MLNINWTCKNAQNVLVLCESAIISMAPLSNIKELGSACNISMMSVLISGAIKGKGRSP